MTEKAGKAPNHWPLLDFLRATAALLVLFGHTRDSYFLYTDVLAQPGLFLKLFYFITDLQEEAVVIFFVLSGFLIGGSLFDSMQRGSFDLVRYLIARFVRIYIVYIPALVITEAAFLVGLLLLSDPGAGFRPLFSLLDLKPDWLSVMIGINDVWRQFDAPLQTEWHVSLDEYVSVLEQLVRAARPQLKGLVLMTPYFIEPNRADPMRAMMDRYGEVVRQLAGQYQAILIDTQAAFERVLTEVHPMALASDRIHPNLVGHMILARAFLKALNYAW